jgi:4-diphosphocytidyl-2C-methyl-D-erythritol kinase
MSTRAVFEVVDGSGPSAHRTPALVDALGAPTLTLPRERGRGKSQGEGESSQAPTLARERGRDMSRQGEFVFGNDLEAASRRMFPGLDEAINRLRDAVPGLTMSGTGAALFGVFERRQDAVRALEAMRGLGYPAWLCRPVPAAA